jgi:hypothetical protein
MSTRQHNGLRCQDKYGRAEGSSDSIIWSFFFGGFALVVFFVLNDSCWPRVKGQAGRII